MLHLVSMFLISMLDFKKAYQNFVLLLPWALLQCKNWREIRQELDGTELIKRFWIHSLDIDAASPSLRDSSCSL